MTKINVADLDAKLREAHIDIDGVALLANGTVRVDFRGEPDAAVAQRAQAVVKAYDQDTVDAAKPKPVTADDVASANTVDDLKALLLKLLNEKA